MGEPKPIKVAGIEVPTEDGGHSPSYFRKSVAFSPSLKPLRA
jgi:hypothetical protein